MDWKASQTFEQARLRANLVNKIRNYFAKQDVIEVDTALLCQGTITDPYIDAIQSTYDWLPEGSKTFYLQTSPEYAMKRLLASGYGDIYQVCKAFRHEPYGTYHNAEFTMLEWYRLGFSMHDLIDDVIGLLSVTLDIKKVEKMTYEDAFIKYLDINPLETSFDKCLEKLSLLGGIEPWLAECNDLDTLLQFMFATYVESNIGQTCPVVIYNFPSSQASLAKIDSKDHRVAKRFEVYFKNVELANGFEELTCAQSQRLRFKEDNLKRKKLGLEQRPVDEKFLASLEAGLPDCSGVALGVDRLVMLATDTHHISEVIPFCVDKT
ncbi:elongation factor P--(R)-beta-lysine ligase [Thalassotalea euphylliae]|uniref:elongation factor P--(R)-beta-lysine ligase n=1 Tax=Thalassotalea euphylliae TaxID=1655234 RepID=UPI00363C5254